MTIGIDASLEANCDECGDKFDEGDKGYCFSCYQDLVDKIKEKDKETEGFEADLSKAMDEIGDLKMQIKSLGE